ncbi:MAG: hypothetical protein GX421_06375 [Caldisericales bacterium]|nr:hypothetical protein [Caldisericales bacterium]
MHSGRTRRFARKGRTGCTFCSRQKPLLAGKSI